MNAEKQTGVFYKSISGSSPVEQWLEEQNVRIASKILRQIEHLEKFWGKTLLPFVKILREGLYELTVKADGQHPRIIFFCDQDDKLIYLHGFMKKQKKTPRKEIDIASKRKNDFCKRKEEKRS